MEPFHFSANYNIFSPKSLHYMSLFFSVINLQSSVGSKIKAFLSILQPRCTELGFGEIFSPQTVDFPRSEYTVNILVFTQGHKTFPA